MRGLAGDENGALSVEGNTARPVQLYMHLTGTYKLHIWALLYFVTSAEGGSFNLYSSGWLVCVADVIAMCGLTDLRR